MNTLISLMATSFDRDLITVHPRVFHIDAAPEGEMRILHVDNGWTTTYFGEDFGWQPRNISADEICNSLVNDYFGGLHHVDEGSRPALFWLPGALDEKIISANYKEKLDEAVTRQNNWFTNLVKEADNEWVMSKGMHKAISDLHRIAAKRIRMDHKPWMVQPVEQRVFCPACQTEVRFGAAVCHNCRCIVDAEKFKSLKFAEA